MTPSNLTPKSSGKAEEYKDKKTLQVLSKCQVK